MVGFDLAQEPKQYALGRRQLKLEGLLFRHHRLKVAGSDPIIDR